MLHHIHRTCPTCGGELVPFEAPLQAHCDRCGAPFEAEERCENGHYLCLSCWREIIGEEILAHCASSKQTDPIALALECMQLPHVRMHGPEHHLLVPAVLLTAYHNGTGCDGLDEHLAEARRRSLQVPGAVCGHWGTCGAAIGAGIFASILEETGPLSEGEWGTLGSLTSHLIATIAAVGGPRCCKRDSLLAIRETIPFANEHLGAHFPDPAPIRCIFFPNNPQCKGRACPFFPTATA